MSSIEQTVVITGASGRIGRAVVPLLRRPRRMLRLVDTSPTEFELRGLSVVSPTVVWASGQRGTVVHTRDGGAHWTRDTIPGALTVTWIEVDPDHQMTLVDATTAIVLEQLANDDYLGTCFATIGALSVEGRFSGTLVSNTIATNTVALGLGHLSRASIGGADGMRPSVHSASSTRMARA